MQARWLGLRQRLHFRQQQRAAMIVQAFVRGQAARRTFLQVDYAL